MRAMKKLIGALLALVMLASAFPLSALAAGKAAAPAAEDMDSEELFYRYMLQLARASEPSETKAKTRGAASFAVRATSLQAAKGTVGSGLTGNEKAMYDALEPWIGQVAEGSVKNTEFEITYAALGVTNLTLTSAEAAQAGKTLVKSNGKLSDYATETFRERLGLDMNAVLTALLMNYPYELYWFDKTIAIAADARYQYNVSYANNVADEIRVVPKGGDTEPNIRLGFYVVAAYSAAGTAGTTTLGSIDPSAAVAAAQSVVASADGLSDYEKLCRFKEYICAQVSYDDACAQASGYLPGHQMLNVFDEDDSTNVVCEGYSKAFKYLCDLADIECYLASGNLTSGQTQEPHMWNIVTLGGKSYLVDLTNCDGDSNSRAVGYPDKMFLKGVSKSSAAGFTACSCDYTYDDNTTSTLSAAKRTLSTADYPMYTVSFNMGGHGAAIAAQSVPLGGKAAEPAQPSAEYYAFDGWFKNSAKTEAFDFLTESITGTTTVYAKWTPKVYSITYDLDGGTLSGTNPASYTVETAPFTLKEPTKAGMAFAGWTGSNGATAQTALAIDPLAAAPNDLSYTANWAAEYSVTVASDLTNGSLSVEPAKGIAGTEVSVTAVPDKGYQLGAVTTTPSLTITDGKFAMPESNVTVRASFTPAALTGTVTVTGTTEAGKTLEASVTETNNTGTLSYQWKADGTDISAATGKSCTLSSAETGKTVTCEVKSSVQTGSILSAPTAAVAAAPTYALSVAGTVNGTARVSRDAAAAGERITVTATPAQDYVLDAITTTPSLTITDGKFTMPASNVTVTVTFKPVERIAGTVTISGHAVVGQTLTASFSGMSRGSTVSYQWMANGTAIAGATGSSYTLTAADAGKSITCVVSNSGQLGTVTSAGTTQVSEDPVTARQTTAANGGSAPTGSTTASTAPSVQTGTAAANAPSVTIFGEPAVGQVLTAVVSGVNAGDLKYRWISDGRPIAGAWAPTYTVTSDDIKHTISVIVTSRTMQGKLRSEETAPVERAALSQLPPVANRNTAAVTPTNTTTNTARASTTPTNSTPTNTTLTSTTPTQSPTTVQEPVPTQTAAPTQPAQSERIFYDVTGSEWFADAVDWAYDHRVMVGTGAHTFSPRVTMNRAMMVQILYNLSGADYVGAVTAFTDVSPDTWYGESVAWAARNGIARSYGNYFGAKDDLTREDMVTMLWNYADMFGYNVSGGAELSGYADSAEISDWAREAMSWAVKNGIVNGVGSNKLSPQGTATRAQLAAIMQRFFGMLYD